jgi:hypothetical protein
MEEITVTMGKNNNPAEMPTNISKRPKANLRKANYSPSLTEMILEEEFQRQVKDQKRKPKKLV